MIYRRFGEGYYIWWVWFSFTVLFVFFSFTVMSIFTVMVLDLAYCYIVKISQPVCENLLSWSSL